MDLFAQPALRSDAEGVAHDQHPDHQFRIDRRAPGCAVEWRQMLAHAAKVDKPVDTSQKVIRRDVIFERELIEQRNLSFLP